MMSAIPEHVSESEARVADYVYLQQQLHQLRRQRKLGTKSHEWVGCRSQTRGMTTSIQPGDTYTAVRNTSSSGYFKGVCIIYEIKKQQL